MYGRVLWVQKSTKLTTLFSSGSGNKIRKLVNAGRAYCRDLGSYIIVAAQRCCEAPKNGSYKLLQMLVARRIFFLVLWHFAWPKASSKEITLFIVHGTLHLKEFTTAEVYLPVWETNGSHLQARIGHWVLFFVTRSITGTQILFLAHASPS